MAYLEVNIAILHPNLDDFTGIRKVDSRVCGKAATAFEDGSKWTAFATRTACNEKGTTGVIVFQNFEIKSDASSNMIEDEIKALCDALFSETRHSLDMIRNNEDVLFRPASTSFLPTTADEVFLRCYIIAMIRQNPDMPTFREGKKLGRNADFHTRDCNNWFLGPKKAVVRVADCIRGLHEFVELAQLSAVNLNLAALVEVPGSTISLEVIQDMTKAVERVFAIIRGVAVAEHWLRENVLVRLRDLDKVQLVRAIADTTTELEESLTQLDGAYEDILDLDAGADVDPRALCKGMLNHAGASIDAAMYLSQLAEAERRAKRGEVAVMAAATTGSAGLAALSYMALAIHPAAGIVAGVSAVSTVVFGTKTVIRYNEMRKSKEVRKLACAVVEVFDRMWKLLCIALWRHNGRLEDDDENMNRFAEQIFRVFRIEDMIGKLTTPEYVREVVKDGRETARIRLDELAAVVRQRRDHQQLAARIQELPGAWPSQDATLPVASAEWLSERSPEPAMSEKASTISVGVTELSIATPSSETTQVDTNPFSQISFPDTEQWRTLRSDESS